MRLHRIEYSRILSASCVAIVWLSISTDKNYLILMSIHVLIILMNVFDSVNVIQVNKTSCAPYVYTFKFNYFSICYTELSFYCNLW